MSKMPGHRLPDNSDIDALINPGDYFRTGDAMWAILPSGEHARIAELWALVEEDDGTLTVGPVAAGKGHSIQSTGTAEHPPWHGFLNHGVWETTT